MKLSLTLHNKTYSVETDSDFDGVNINDITEQFKGLLVNAGFHPSNVDGAFNTEYQWFTEEERANNLQGHNHIVEDWVKECEKGESDRANLKEDDDPTRVIDKDFVF